MAAGRDSVNDLYSVGKSMFIAMIMVVTCEIGLLARFWTWEFCLCAFFSYVLVRLLYRFGVFKCFSNAAKNPQLVLLDVLLLRAAVW